MIDIFGGLGELRVGGCSSVFVDELGYFDFCFFWCVGGISVWLGKWNRKSK